MARIRTIKPEFFRHEDLYELEVNTHLPIRVAYAGLFTVADREGRFKWKPASIKLDILPFDEVNINDVLNALWVEGFIKKYEIEGKVFGCIPSWLEHQKIRHDEAKSAIPAPEQRFFLNPLELVTNSREPESWKGREGKGNGKDISVENSTTIDQKKEDDQKKENSAISDPDCTPNSISTASGNNLTDSLTDVEAESLKKNKKNVAPEKFPFDDFWNLYEKKRGKSESIRQWARLSDEDKQAVMKYIPGYKKAQPDENYRKDPERFLKKRSWLDELPKQKFSNNGTEITAFKQTGARQAAGSRAEIEHLMSRSEDFLRQTAAEEF